jgi:soluble lytic murein transglycosylase
MRAARGALPLAVAVAGFALALLGPAGCRRDTRPPAASNPSASPPHAKSVAPPAAASATKSDVPERADDPLLAVDHRALIAAEAWDLAARAIDALDEAARSSVSARLARVRAAIGRCTTEEGARAVAAIVELRKEKALASHDPLLTRFEIDALLCAGRPKEALAIGGPSSLALRKGPAAAWTRARALEAAGDLAAARRALDDAIAAPGGLPLGALLRARIRITRALGESDEADRLRLYLELPAEFEQLTPPGAPPITAQSDGAASKFLRRADAYAAIGRADDAERAVDAAAGAGATARAVARARGRVLYRAKSYARAAAALRAAVQLSTQPSSDDEALEDAFLAARATSRSGDDPAAIVAYETLAKASPQSRWGADAAYLAAHLRWLAGAWNDARQAFERYLSGPWAKHASQRSNRREARRQRAFALLELGDATSAAKAFRSIADDKDLEGEPFAKARYELLEAIAIERSGDRPAALAIYQTLSRAHPHGYLDLAARSRRRALGDSIPDWPRGPVARAGLAVDPGVADPLIAAGLHREAAAILAVPKDDVARCTLFDALDAGWEAYRIGVRLTLGSPREGAGPEGELARRWRCAYPTPHAAVVDALEAREGLPRGLLHAILRQESAFRVEVVSPAGAVGIAQLMPATAAATAAKIGKTIDQTDIAALTSPFLQLDLAARHLHDLYDELADPADPASATPLVIAAYNAGAGAVRRWLREAGGLDTDLFLERIPFLETRGYVARVLGNQIRYAIMAGETPPSLPRTLPPAR